VAAISNLAPGAEGSEGADVGSVEVVGLSAVLRGLDVSVFRRVDPATFILLTACPEWLEPLIPRSAAVGSRLSLHGKSEYLDHFLVDAHEFWGRTQSGRMSSGPWIAGEWPLEAQALVEDRQSFLVISHLGDAYRERVSLLQAARSHLLGEERLEREIRRRTQSIRDREEELAMRLLAAAGTRDEETGSHVRRIGLCSAAMGMALGWDDSRVADIRIAAPMHDIGKIGIPDSILLKPGRLDPAELRVMQQHTVIGSGMLSGSEIPLLKMGSEIALCHHEKWDGSGYPQGLAGEAIPVAARIVAIVDVYDAMIHRRVYKDPIPEQSVLETMKNAAGRHFDPALFDVFMSILPTIRQIREQEGD
jgi:putative two-component system response regulator